MQNLELFTKELLKKPELYNDHKTFYIKMRNANETTKTAYNKVKNALMSYASKLDKTLHVEPELGPMDESFYAGELAARFVFVNGYLYIHLKTDPTKLNAKKAIFKVTENQMVVYKLEKPNVVEQAVAAIPKMMAAFSYATSSDYQEEDYASFYCETVSEIADVVSESQRQYEENLAVGQAEPEPEYGDYYDENNTPRSVDEKFFAVAAEMPTDDALLEEAQKRKNSKRKIKLWSELSSYGYDFIWSKYVAFYLVTIIIGVALSIAYQLKFFWALVLIAGLLLMMPGIVKSYYRNKYEERRHEDVTTYIEQMLYSFRKNSKILVSLRDALTVFPEGTHMHDTISAAIHHAQSSMSGSNLYTETLSIIEKEYPCRRIRSLHRYMIKVEGLGGDHTAGIEALLKDRRLWIERTDNFKKDAKKTMLDIYISIGFSVALACMVVRMMSTPLVDIPSNLLYQISSVVFLLIAALTITIATKKTVLSLEDEENEVSSSRIVRKINWLRNYDSKAELKKSLKVAAIFALFLILGIFLKNTVIIIFSAVLIVYALFLKRALDKNSATKTVCREIEKAYPDWLLELALLLQIDNLHVAIEKTIDDAPLIIRGDLKKLDEEIVRNPTSIEPYSGFFNFLPVPHVHSSMKLLYSISEFGQEKGSTQLMELIERNSMLMDKAEKYRNEDRLSITFALKFVPMGLSSMKLLVDLVVMLISYMGIISNIGT